MLARARARAADVAFAGGELTALPFPAADVDLVVSGLALTHVDDPAPVYAEFARVLNRGGDPVVSDVHEGLPRLGRQGHRTGRATAAGIHHSSPHGRSSDRGAGRRFHRAQLPGDASADHTERAVAGAHSGDRGLAPLAVDPARFRSGGDPRRLEHPGDRGLALPAYALSGHPDDFRALLRSGL